ncbi:DUF305 domain-containing protein [Nocardia sp. 2]|uniref:DUF305 domain-containing protein n=1 Tax=Nocardia acididurans TaxID=2802282 RepID=A0ABS1M2Z7_9NOCA|nr:DUF305 domain-containing protein [Nocardia acididurans]MBL1074896.1 DUF305 domain-containing protein [Nocardia acididurans]
MAPLVPDDEIRDFGGADPADAPARTGQRTALLVLGVIGVLLLGVALGVLLRIPLDNKADTAPSPVDVGFCQDMSVHHQQAVEMSAVAFSGSTDPAVKRLAYDILTTQQSQAGRMQGWLQMWGEPMLPVGGYMGWMSNSSGAGHHGGTTTAGNHSGPVQSMPGMASTEELTALGKATGPALDVMFLQLMLRHHQGGMPMIEYATQHADTDAVRSLATSMAKTQAGESQLMTTMLTERGATPLPMN